MEKTKTCHRNIIVVGRKETKRYDVPALSLWGKHNGV